LTPAQQKEAAPHELAHAIARVNPRGFNSDVQAFNNAFNQCKINNPNATETFFTKKYINICYKSKNRSLFRNFFRCIKDGKMQPLNQY